MKNGAASSRPRAREWTDEAGVARRRHGAAREPRAEPVHGGSGLRRAPWAVPGARAAPAFAAASGNARRPRRRRARRARADRGPPSAEAPRPQPLGRRPAVDREASGLSPPRGSGVLAVRPRRHVAPRRRARLAAAAAADREIRPLLSVRAGRVRRVLPALHDRCARPNAVALRRLLADNTLPARAHLAGHG